MGQIFDLNVSPGKIDVLEAFKPKRTPGVLPEVLGPNEFLGLCLPFDVASDSGEAVERGAIDCSELVLTLHEHSIPVGVARLIERPEGIYAHGRIANNTGTSVTLLKAIYGGIQHNLNPPFPAMLCLSCSRERQTTRLINGRTVVVTLEGKARELTICLQAGFEGCGIMRLGPLNVNVTQWDESFWPAGARFLFQASAEHLRLYSRVREREYNDFLAANPLQQNGVTYEQWISTLAF